MLLKSSSLHSITRSVLHGSLLLATAAGLSATARAGVEYAESKDKSKDKNIIEQAPPAEPKFYVDVSGGAEFDVHATRFISNGNAIFNGAAYNGFGGNLYSAKIQTRDFTSTHDLVTNARAEVGYHVLPYLALFGGFTYSHANGHERRVGFVNDDIVTLEKHDLYASVGDYQAYSGRAGFKLTLPRTILDFIHAPKAITPYFMGSVGGKYIESQEVSFYSGTRTRFVDTAYDTLYGNTWVLTAEAAFGYELKLTRNASIVLENGYGYDTKPDNKSLPGISGVNNGGDRLYSTVSLGAKVKF